MLPIECENEEMYVSDASKFVNMISNGKKFENVLYDFLKSKYPTKHIEEQVKVGKKIGVDKKYIVDVLIDRKVLVSAKFQDIGGTAEQKIPHEIVNLQHLCETYGYEKAYIVYSGTGFTLMESYKSPEMSKYINAPNVKILSFEEFKEEKIDS